ncbi:ABC transporter permease [Acidicapsa ligni]|uniref:ABC transporter permease n=1 Tax=Acidicapsa ligni TaxID=542300 RepID=UPI0021DF5D9D|nr:ABC transporter permease [Acidicapsa ligni]
MDGDRHLNELDQEIRDHIDFEVQENLARGMTPEQARTAASRKFGNVSAIREETYTVWHRVWLQQALQDIRYALRQLSLAPVFTVTVMLTLGLGIGATTAIFSLVHAVMLRSLPVVDPSHLYRIGSGNDCCSTGALQGNWQVFSYSLYKQIEAAAPQFDNVAAFQGNAGVLSVRDSTSISQARPLLGEYVSGNYFQTFGLQAFAGRLITKADDQQNATPVAVLSYRSWQQNYNSSPSVIGATFNIETHPFTIIGIAPPGFFGETLSSTPTEIWVPLQTEFLTDGKDAFNLIPSQAWLHLIGHLRPGASIGGVSDALTATLQHWLITDADLPPQNRPRSAEQLTRQTIQITPGGSGIGTMRDAYQDSLRLLFALCLAVLLIACANIANLLLVRGIARRGQIALQLALGASRLRILRQALTESSVLALLGGIAGIGLSWLGAKLVIAVAFRHSTSVPIDVRPSLPVLGFCLGLSLLTGLLFGTVPAWLSSATDPIQSLRGANRATHKSAALPQKLLIVFQSALSVVLIAVASMLTHSILNLQNQDLGFATANRLSIQMEPPLADYTLDQLSLRYRDLRARLAQLPGVHNASLALDGPVIGGWQEAVVKPGEGMPRLDGSENTMWNRVSPGYFETIGLPILQGRGILDSDRADTRGVVVVNQAFVKKFLSGQPPIGKYFGFHLPAYSNAFEIVGVVADAKSGDLSKPPPPMAFGALAQHIIYTEEILQADDKWDHFINEAQLYYSGDLGTLEPRIREAFRLVDPNFAIIDIQPVQQLVDTQFDQQRAVAQLSGLFGILALVLASIGLYGVTAYTVARRTSEIGIRMAVGANRTNIAALIFRGAFTQVTIGLILGIPLAILFGKLLANRLYQVSILDPTALLIAIGTLILGATVASMIPARRAASTNLIQTLRAD